jgi:hypothetical protein
MFERYYNIDGKNTRKPSGRRWTDYQQWLQNWVFVELSSLALY